MATSWNRAGETCWLSIPLNTLPTAVKHRYPLFSLKQSNRLACFLDECKWPDMVTSSLHTNVNLQLHWNLSAPASSRSRVSVRAPEHERVVCLRLFPRWRWQLIKDFTTRTLKRDRRRGLPKAGRESNDYCVGFERLKNLPRVMCVGCCRLSPYSLWSASAELYRAAAAPETARSRTFKVLLLFSF